MDAVWWQVHRLVLMLEEKKLVRGLHEVFRQALSMSLQEIWLYFSPQRCTFHMYILGVVNTVLVFHILWLFSSLPKCVLGSDHRLYFLISLITDQWFTSFTPLSMHSILSRVDILNTSHSLHLFRYPGRHPTQTSSHPVINREINEGLLLLAETIPRDPCSTRLLHTWTSVLSAR